MEQNKEVETQELAANQIQVSFRKPKEGDKRESIVVTVPETLPESVIEKALAAWKSDFAKSWLNEREDATEMPESEWTEAAMLDYFSSTRTTNTPTPEELAAFAADYISIMPADSEKAVAQNKNAAAAFEAKCTRFANSDKHLAALATRLQQFVDLAGESKVTIYLKNRIEKFLGKLQEEEAGGQYF